MFLNSSPENLDNENSTNEIRKETFGHFLKSIFCPSFKFLSVTFIISCIDLIIYIITLCFGIKNTPTELLAPKYETLDTFGMKIPFKIYKGQIHRLILFGLLHANCEHIISNLISQIIIGSFLEFSIGSLNFLLLYLLSNIGGGLFSCVINNNAGVGASVAIFGMLGGYIGFLLTNWNYLDKVMGGPMGKFFNLMFLIFIALINVSYGFNNSTIDNFGHLGGLIYGFLLIFIITNPKEENDGVCCSFGAWRTIMIIISVGLTLLLGLLFWLLVKPVN